MSWEGGTASSHLGHRQVRPGRSPPLFLVGVLGSLALRGQEGDLYFLEPGAQFIQGFPRTLLAPGEGVCLPGECWLMVDWRLAFPGCRVLLLQRQRQRQQGSEKIWERPRHLLDSCYTPCVMLQETPVGTAHGGHV